jgi:diguanylate cyclase (GGDEF)-like protein
LTYPSTIELRRMHDTEHVDAGSADSRQAPRRPLGGNPVPPSSASQGDDPAKIYTEELEHGQRWLRFSPTLERQFQLDTSKQRFMYLIGCQVLGVISLWIGIANEKNVIPATVNQVMPGWIAVMAFFSTTIIVQALVGIRTMSRGWLMDWTCALNGLVIAVGIVLATNSDPTLMASVHAANVVLVVMWFCVLCRLRMRVALTATLATALMYIALAKAPSPSQKLIYLFISQNLFFTTVFSLGVAYFLEYRERRTYLLRKHELVQQDLLAQARERLHELAIQDPLTGLHNRRQFGASFDVAWSQAVFARHPVGLLMVDIDYFKLYNDTYGHPVGDGCLKAVAAVLSQVATEEGGSAARIGGEEFLLLLPTASLEAVQRAGQAVCERIRAASVEHKTSKVAPHVTVSVGGAWAQPTKQVNIEVVRQTMMSEADAALYQAKEAGRNRAVVREEAVAALEAPAVNPNGASLAQEESTASGDAEVFRVGSPGGDSLAELSALIKSKFLGLRFNAALECEYQSGQVDLRRQYLVISGCLGIAIFNAFWLLNYQLIADVADWFKPRQWLMAALMLSNLLIIARPTVKPWLREFIYALNVCAVALLTTLAFGRSHMPSAYAGYVAVFLVPLFACVATRQPFWATAFTSIVTLGGFLSIVNPVTAIEKVMAWDVTMMLITATNFIFIASYTLEHGERMDYLLERLGLRQRQALGAAVDSLHKLSCTDPLTGISNRRHFEAEFEVAAAHRDGRMLAMLVMDVDHFKAYNDGYGHTAGDGCLKSVAQAIKDAAATDGYLAARLGGEEFGVLVPGCDAAHAARLGQKICDAMRDANLPHQFSKVARHVTVSVGVAAVNADDGVNLTTLLSMADEALYRAKIGGRNRVELAASAREAAPLQEARLQALAQG